MAGHILRYKKSAFYLFIYFGQKQQNFIKIIKNSTNDFTKHTHNNILGLIKKKKTHTHTHTQFEALDTMTYAGLYYLAVEENGPVVIAAENP